MSRRQTEGAETWRRLRDWDRGQAAAERLAAQILRAENYTSVDPSHPLGGQDGLKDVVCKRGNQKWIGAAYFPRGQQDFSEILGKFKHDLDGVSKNQAEGIAFITNQELTLGERERLIAAATPVNVDLFHLERVSSILDQPICYGLRLEYLDIEMTKEEQLAFIAMIQLRFDELRLDREVMLSLIATSETLMREFQSLRAVKAQGGIPQEPFYVTPEHFVDPFGGTMQIDSSGSLIINTNKIRPHRCTSCGFGYFIKGSSPPHTLAPLIGTAAVTCPKCGNVDEVRLYY